MNNPWNLTPREAQIMNRLTEIGLEKIVAMELGISHKTVQELVNRAKRRIGARTRVTAILEWDRWARAKEVAA
jgi:DNA-binding CsgD family transcriptional regulator